MNTTFYNWVTFDEAELHQIIIYRNMQCQIIEKFHNSKTFKLKNIHNKKIYISSNIQKEYKLVSINNDVKANII